jgi:hypothetical protein
LLSVSAFSYIEILSIYLWYIVYFETFVI